jgi:iron complex outermembrane receptor protein
MVLKNVGFGLLWIRIAAPAWAEMPEVKRIHDLTKASTQAADLLAQAAVVQVTGIKLNLTETELEIILETAENQPLRVDTRNFVTQGNRTIADLPNVILALPQGQEFSAIAPAPGVASITITQLNSTTVRIDAAGSTAPPANVVLKAGNLVYSLQRRCCMKRDCGRVVSW